MLHPETTVLLTDALRPPAGYHLDHAVATTYTLNLTALLIAPMTFSLGDVDSADALASGDPVRLLDAVQRHVEHTTVFVQTAGIHVPASHSRIHTFLEDSIHEVLPPNEGHLFHPKLWAVRFAGEAGALHHRVIVASRNLTLDNSWDTVLVLDEDPDGTIPAAPAADAVAALPTMTLDPLPEARAAAVADVARTLRAVTLAAPEPFTGGSLLPLGLGDDRPWPFPANPERVLAISPFVSAETLKSIRGTSAEATLVSRAEAMDLLGRNALKEWSTKVLHRAAEEGDDDQSSLRVVDEFTAITDTPDGADESGAVAVIRLDGLHAKTVVLDLPGGQSMVVTGSANLTGQAWSGGMEMNAVLTGPTATCGVHAVLGQGRESLGLDAILQPYTPQHEAGATDPAITTSYRLEQFHRELARQRPELVVTELDEDRVEARLSLTMPDDGPGQTRVWLTTVPAQVRDLAPEQSWEVAPVNVTPYLAVETTAGEGEGRVTRRCILMMRLRGDTVDRRGAVLAALLSNQSAVLRYLALLLGLDPLQSESAPLEDVMTVTEQLETAGDGGTGPQLPPIVLFEPLVRAAGRDPQAMASVARQVAELREMPGAEDLVPPEFLQMWDVVLRVAQKRRQP
ncbi:hypothetical protein AB0K08_02025 [Citricoccus sp. NPDC055426]|uniref:hypothetical protein n=1 Tax=Citricoccus sp. NPDC055426 TaxID=3155536 RepID=UPI00343D306D